MPANLHVPAESAVQPWPHPPASMVLGADEVHVWRASLKHPPHRLQQLRGTLSADEAERAALVAEGRDWQLKCWQSDD